MIKLFIGICAVLAVVMIVLGGLEYMTSELISSKEQGKERITHAIFGLVLALGAWTLLYQINSSLLNCAVALLDAKVAVQLTTTVPVNFLSSPADLSEDAQNRSVLAANGINAPAACANGVTTNCVNLNNLNDNTMVGVETLAKAACGSTPGCVYITGGTEAGHDPNGAHPDGYGLDLKSNDTLNAFISTNRQPCQTYTPTGGGGGTYLWEPKGSTCGGSVPSSGDHWHVSYP